jgi:hypothetical protein
MDTGAWDGGYSATLGGTDLKAVRHREYGVIVSLWPYLSRGKFDYTS